VCSCNTYYYSLDGFAPCSLINPDISGPTTFNLNTVVESQSLTFTTNVPVTWSYGFSRDNNIVNYASINSADINILKDDTTFILRFEAATVIDNGTQNNPVYFNLVATNDNGVSRTFTSSGYAYPYVINNWDSSVGPNVAFGIWAPNKVTNSGLKASYIANEGGVYRLNTGNYTTSYPLVRKELIYDYHTRQIKAKSYVTGSTFTDLSSSNLCLNAVQYKKMPFTTCNQSDNKQKFNFIRATNYSPVIGSWRDVYDGPSWRLNGGLGGGNNYQMYEQGGFDGNSQLQNFV